MRWSFRQRPDSVRCLRFRLYEFMGLLIDMDARIEAAIARMTQEVTDTRGLAASAVTALNAIPELIRQAVADAMAGAGGDPQAVADKVNELADALDAAQAPLALAVQSAGAQPTGSGTDTTSGDSTGTETAPAGDDTAPAGGGQDTVAGDPGSDTLSGGPDGDSV